MGLDVSDIQVATALRRGRTRAVGHARQALRVIGFGAITGAMLPGFVVHHALCPPERRRDVRDRWVRVWSDALLRLFSIRADVRRVDASGLSTPSTSNDDLRAGRGPGRLVVANHRSTIDIAVLLRTFGGHMVSRGDVAEWPLVGAAARSVGTVFVDRTNAMSGATAVRAIRELLRDGETVCIFPEGTTFPDDEVRPFHPGAFVAALHTGASVVPVGIAYERGSGAAFFNESFGKHLARMSASGETRVAVRVGEPITIHENMRAAALRERTHTVVQDLVRIARQDVDGVDSLDDTPRSDATRRDRG